MAIFKSQKARIKHLLDCIITVSVLPTKTVFRQFVTESLGIEAVKELAIYKYVHGSDRFYTRYIHKVYNTAMTSDTLLVWIDTHLEALDELSE